MGVWIIGSDEKENFCSAVEQDPRHKEHRKGAVYEEIGNNDGGSSAIEWISSMGR